MGKKPHRVGIPRFVVAQVHLDQADARFHQLPSHEQRPAKRIAAITILRAVVCPRYIESPLHLGIGQQRNVALPVTIEVDRLGQLV